MCTPRVATGSTQEGRECKYAHVQYADTLFFSVVVLPQVVRMSYAFASQLNAALFYKRSFS